MSVKKGKVKWFNLRKGFGFIRGDDGEEIFVHFTGIKRGHEYTGVDDGDEVEYEVESGAKGKPQAINVRLTGEARKVRNT